MGASSHADSHALPSLDAAAYGASPAALTHSIRWSHPNQAKSIKLPNLHRRPSIKLNQTPRPTTLAPAREESVPLRPMIPRCNRTHRPAVAGAPEVRARRRQLRATGRDDLQLPRARRVARCSPATSCTCPGVRARCRASLSRARWTSAATPRSRHARSSRPSMARRTSMRRAWRSPAWIREYYLAPAWETYALMLPPGAGERPQTAIVRGARTTPEPRISRPASSTCSRC